MNILRHNKFFLYPSLLTVLVYFLVKFFPEIFTPMVVALMYWASGSTILVMMTRTLREELRQRKQISHELEHQKNYLEQLIESAPEGIVWADANHKIKYVNKKFCEIFEFSKAEAIGQNVDILLSSPENRREAEEITKAIAMGVTRQFDGIRYTKSQTPIEVSIIGSPFAGRDGKLEVFGIYRDISAEAERERQLKKSEQELRFLSAQLTESNRFKELLLDIITHDLRNPAGVIAGVEEMLSETYPENDLIQLLRTGTRNLFEVINTTSTLSKLSIGERIAMEVLDLVPLLTEVTVEFESQAKANNMRIELEHPAELMVEANPIIKEVFRNYLSNAIKYAQHSPRILVRAYHEDEHTVVEFADWGETIHENHREHIFNRNVQLSSGPKRGSGLGLAIVRRIATAHHGTAGVKPNQPTGNIFYFQFGSGSTPEST